MRITYLGISLAFIVAACNNSKTKTTENGSSVESAGNNNQSEKNSSAANGYWQKLVMNEIGDGKGGIAAIIPFPAGWKLGNAGGAAITGPHGIKVTDFPLQSFMMNYNQNLQQAYAAGGQQMREMPGIEQLIQEDFVPWGNNRGLQFVKHYEIPEVGKMDKWYSDQLFKAMPSRSEVTAIGTEWKTKEGNPYFLLIHLNASSSQAMQNWSYYASGLEAEPEYFEAATKQYIFGLANIRHNLEPIMAYNREEAQRVGANWAAFNQRMAQNQASFEASQRAFVNKSNAINDAIMSGWRERNASSDVQQAQTIDGIYERTNVQDGSTGKTYKVAEGANQYWMNSNGEYIGTQLQGYDPNQDKNMNEVNWQELKRVKQQ